MKYKMNTLYNMDCMEALKDIPDNVITRRVLKLLNYG